MSATHRRRPAVLGWLLLLVACLLIGEPAAAAGGPESAAMPPPLMVAAESAAVTVLVDDLPGAGDVAAPPTGQTLYVIDEDGHGVVAVDPFEPGRRWMAVAAAGAASSADRSPVPTAIGCIDSATLALACRQGNQWVLRTHRLKPPGSAADPAAPLQSLSLGGAAPAGSPAAVQLAVSQSRNWLVVAGLPAPLPAVTRAAIDGARLAPASSRNCPEIPASLRSAAVSVSPFDELVLFMAPAATGSAADTFLSFHSPLRPQRLLHVATSLTNVRDAAFCRGDGSLWVVAGEQGSETQPEGLWRIDAVMRDFRQAVQAVCVAKLPAPRSVVCLSERAIVVTHGTGPRRVVRIDPSPAASGQLQP